MRAFHWSVAATVGSLRPSCRAPHSNGTFAREHKLLSHQINLIAGRSILACLPKFLSAGKPVMSKAIVSRSQRQGFDQPVNDCELVSDFHNRGFSGVLQ